MVSIISRRRSRVTQATSRKNWHCLMNLKIRTHWQLENEKPAKLVWNTGFPTLEGMTVLDGTQVWRNPRFSNAPNRQA
jgi:hypothetical protein